MKATIRHRHQLDLDGNPKCETENFFGKNPFTKLRKTVILTEYEKKTQNSRELEIENKSF